MLRPSLLLAAALLPASTLACSEGIETGTEMTGDDDAPDDDSAADDDATASDDDSSDDDATGDDDATSDDDSGDDDATDDDVAGDDDATEGSETLIDVATAPRDVASYATDKEFITDTATVEVTESDGDPPPALRIELPFTNYNQFIEFQYLADQVNGGMYWDLTGKVLTLRLKVEQHGYDNLECPGGIRFFVKTGETYVYGGRQWISTPEASSSWLSFDFNLSRAEVDEGLELDPSDVRAIGFGFESADCGMVYLPGEDPPEEAPPTTAVFIMEDITVRNEGL